MSDVDALVQIIWDFMLVDHELRPTECIFALGSHDISVADYAITLYKQGYAPWLMFSGGVIHRNAELGVTWDQTEAELFAGRAAQHGVTVDRVLIENRATNTGENFRFARQLLDDMQLKFESFILLQKPYMERRVMATALQLWPDVDFIVASPPISCRDYLNGDLPKDAVIQHIVGDFHRVKIYGENGFQAPQVIPEDVWSAFEALCALGYDQRLVDV